MKLIIDHEKSLIIYFHSLGWFGVVGVYGLFITSTFINKFIMGPIVSYVFLQERREGDFR